MIFYYRNNHKRGFFGAARLDPYDDNHGTEAEIHISHNSGGRNPPSGWGRTSLSQVESICRRI